jgi:hypothetical protein
MVCGRFLLRRLVHFSISFGSDIGLNTTVQWFVENYDTARTGMGKEND